MRRLLSLAAIAALAAAGASARPAAADPQPPQGAPTATWTGTGAGYQDVIDVGGASGREATVVENFEIEGGDVVGSFCVDAPVAFNQDPVPYHADRWSSVGRPGLDRAARLAADSDGLGSPLPDANAEATAVQLAIWHFTNGVDYSTVPNATIVARADELVALAAAAPEFPEPPSSFDLDVTVTPGEDETHLAHVSFRTNTGTGQDVTVELAWPGGTQTVTLSTTGEADVPITPTAAGTLTVTWNGTLPPGVVLRPADGQPVITTDAAAVSRVATAPLSAPGDSAPPTTTPPTTTPPTTTPPTTAPTPPDELPYTGTWATPAVALGAAAAAATALAVRRRLLRRYG